MSQNATEATLGRLLCDDEFRREFFRDTQAAVRHSGIDLTDVELRSLIGIRRRSIEKLASGLDDRIRRAGDDL
jgi:hypothetical protein